MKEEFNPEVENTTLPEMNAQPVEPTTPVAPTEPVAPVAPVEPVVPVQTESVQPTPLQPIEEEVKPKKKSIIPTLLIIFFILLIAGCLVYYFFFKDKLGGNTNEGTTTTTTATTVTTEATTEDTTTTTSSVLTEVEAKNKITELLGKYYYNSLFEFDTWCGGDVLDMETSISLGNDKNAYKVKNYSTIADIKKSMESFMSSTLIDKQIAKFTEKDGSLYCYVPASSYAFVNNNSVEVLSVEVTSEQISAKAKYTTGGDEMYSLETKQIEVVSKNVNNTWIIDSIK